jgi:transposase-like protein
MQPVTNIMQLMERYPDESSARKYFEHLRWGDKITCPHCESSKKIYSFNDGKLYKCSECKKQFTVRVGTIFEQSSIPLRKWLFALYMTINHKKGISSIQLSKDLGVTQKSAWFMLHRIRKFTENKDMKLKGTVEADESYFGGKDANKHEHKRGKKPKIMVIGAVERGGNVITQVGDKDKTNPPFIFVLKNVEKGSKLMTDESNNYKLLKTTYNHQTVHHTSKEYVRGEVHIQTLEGFWSHVKRGINGVQHHVSPKHLERYLFEYDMRWNTRTLTDMQRFELVMAKMKGRLTYKDLIAKI